MKYFREMSRVQEKEADRGKGGRAILLNGQGSLLPHVYAMQKTESIGERKWNNLQWRHNGPRGSARGNR